MPDDEWDSYPGFDDEEDDDVDCLGHEIPDEWLDQADEDKPEGWDSDIVA